MAHLSKVYICLWLQRIRGRRKEELFIEGTKRERKNNIIQKDNVWKGIRSCKKWLNQRAELKKRTKSYKENKWKGKIIEEYNSICLYF